MLRFSIEHAVSKGWITKDQASKQKEVAQKGRNAYAPGGGDSKATAPTTNSHAEMLKKRQWCEIDGELPQERLWRACVKRWPERIASRNLVWEYPGAVPGRRFRLDIAFVDALLAVETDGWLYHGKYLDDFKRDRARDRLLVRNGWRVIRFFSSEILNDPVALTDEIQEALDATLDK